MPILSALPSDLWCPPGRSAGFWQEHCASQQHRLEQGPPRRLVHRSDGWAILVARDDVAQEHPQQEREERAEVLLEILALHASAAAEVRGVPGRGEPEQRPEAQDGAAKKGGQELGARASHLARCSIVLADTWPRLPAFELGRRSHDGPSWLALHGGSGSSNCHGWNCPGGQLLSRACGNGLGELPFCPRLT